MASGAPSAARLWRFVALAGLTSGCGSVQLPTQTAALVRADALTQIRLESPDEVELWETTASRPSRVCVSPCESQLEVRGRRFEVRVSELPDSPVFELPPAERLRVTVRPSTRALMGAGATLSVLGGTAMVAGGLTAGLDAAGREDFQGATLPGLVTLAAGSAVLAGGLVCAALSGTEVSISEIAKGGGFRF